ncbi:MAG: hypothetical protein A3A86_01380 [Elusimicrobia bacterium RIFCSPLOWO2_01_FULL_60_11]|nr:MAG: hypothetical protein A3A86_01380 [Elusimicrobia bacterium RIFCSPLOWO2_01_FULL_60_11]
MLLQIDGGRQETFEVYEMRMETQAECDFPRRKSTIKDVGLPGQVGRHGQAVVLGNPRQKVHDPRINKWLTPCDMDPKTAVSVVHPLPKFEPIFRSDLGMLDSYLRFVPGDETIGATVVADESQAPGRRQGHGHDWKVYNVISRL